MYGMNPASQEGPRAGSRPIAADRKGGFTRPENDCWLRCQFSKRNGLDLAAAVNVVVGE